MNKDLMTRQELNERLDGTNGLELSVEKYIRLIENWGDEIKSNLWYDTCGLCQQYYKPSVICDDSECPLLLMGERCGGLSLWKKICLCFREGKQKESKRYAEEVLRYLWQALRYQDPTKARRFIEKEVELKE